MFFTANALKALVMLTLCASASAQDVNATALKIETFLEEAMKYVLSDYIDAASSMLDLLNTTQVVIVSSPSCLQDLTTTLENVKKREVWALNILDSFGKPPPGINRDNRIWFGSYDQCKASTAYKSFGSYRKPFTNQYCNVQVQFPGTVDSKLRLTVGLCLPESCKANDTMVFARIGMLALEKKSLSENTTFDVVHSWCSGKRVTFSTDAFVILTILFVWLILIFVATIYDLVLQGREKGRRRKIEGMKNTYSIEMNQSAIDEMSAQNGDVDPRTSDLTPESADEMKFKNTPSKGKGLFLALSLYTNGKKLLSTHQPDGTLTAIHGIRFFSMVWIIQGHTLFWLQLTDNWANRQDVQDMLSKYGSMYYHLLTSGEFGVDTFFLLSGTLVSYLFLPEMKRRGGPKKVNWFYYFFYRWWRLTPTLWLVMVAYIFLFRNFYDGPNYPTLPMGVETQCAVWPPFVYLNNYLPGCMGWTWYLASDWQYYCGAPLIFVCFHRSWKLGIGSIVVCIAVQICATVAVTVSSGYNPMIGSEDHTYYGGIYRIGDYAVGLCLGYILQKHRERKFEISRGKQALAWLVMIFFWVPVLFPWHSTPAIVGELGNLAATAVYMGLKRWWWTVGVAWIIFACSTGYGGFINTFMSWPALIPLSRLTYCAYLIHPVLMYVYEYGRRTTFHATDITIHYLITGHLFNTYCLAFFISLTLESPMISLGKVFMTCKGSGCCRKNKDNQAGASSGTETDGAVNRSDPGINL